MAHVDVRQATDEHFVRIHRAALVLSGNPWDADDLAQETFLVLTRNPDAFSGRSSLYTWLYGVLLNLDRRRRRTSEVRRRKLHVLWDAEPTVERTIPAAETPIEVAEWKKSLWSLVAQLPSGQREVLVLRFSEHLRYEEIAEAVGCPLGTVKSRIFHGLAALRVMVSEMGDELGQVPRHAWEDLRHVV